MKQKLFTKSAFKIALTCPTQLYYYYDSEHYGNQNVDDDFLQSLAEGGFQVGELAKVYYGITPEHNIETLDYAESIAQTKALLEHNENINIAEAAFQIGNCFVRVDILEKKGNQINLIEVKAKSWKASQPFTSRRDQLRIESNILPYLYDVAFQKWVTCQALNEWYPHPKFTVNSYLMMADKSKVAPVNGINQLFTIVHKNHRTFVQTHPAAKDLASQEHILTPFDVNDLCDAIIEGRTEEQPDVMGTNFMSFVHQMSQAYCEHTQLWTPLSSACFTCPFHADAQHTGDGYKKCWGAQAHFTKTDFDRPLVQDLWNTRNKDSFLKEGRYFLEDLDEKDITVQESPKGLHPTQRKIVQIGLAAPEDTPAQQARKNKLLAPYASNIHEGVYLDIPGLREEMATWKYPLHMIDFETTAVALPFYKGMHPYEQVAFQFSHHIIDKASNGHYTIKHAGQYINTKKGFFPNFEFLRELKRQLSTDDGSVFRYATHENSILLAIREQLQRSDEPDKEELIQFINSLTHEGDARVGERNMIDLLEVVKRYFYHPIMKGSNSIKVVLPAVLNASALLQKKYSEPIYGTPEIPSQNNWSFSASGKSTSATSKKQGKVWIQKADDGVVQNPYKLLPFVHTFLPVEIQKLAQWDASLDESIANGGAALAAYSKLQFSEGNVSKAFVSALLHYCELDTLSMVFIWEYFNDVIQSPRKLL